MKAIFVVLVEIATARKQFLKPHSQGFHSFLYVVGMARMDALDGVEIVLEQVEELGNFEHAAGMGQGENTSGTVENVNGLLQGCVFGLNLKFLLV